MTYLTPGACEAMVRAADRAASLGTCPLRVTIPCFVETSINAALSNGSANIFAWMSVVIVAPFFCCMRSTRTGRTKKRPATAFEALQPPVGDAACRSAGGGTNLLGRGALDV
jgi:hypothetical protein